MSLLSDGHGPAEEADIHAGLIAGLEDDTSRPVVGRELPLGEAATAHQEILTPGAAGKIVLLSRARQESRAVACGSRRVARGRLSSMGPSRGRVAGAFPWIAASAG
jgi:hypothetical protein